MLMTVDGWLRWTQGQTMTSNSQNWIEFKVMIKVDGCTMVINAMEKRNREKLLPGLKSREAKLRAAILWRISLRIGFRAPATTTYPPSSPILKWLKKINVPCRVQTTHNSSILWWWTNNCFICCTFGSTAASIHWKT